MKRNLLTILSCLLIPLIMSPVTFADGFLDGSIGDAYGATRALDARDDGECGINTVDRACGRGDLIDLNALAWPGGSSGYQWFFGFTIDSPQTLLAAGGDCEQGVNYFIGIDVGCDGAPALDMANPSLAWQRNFSWEVDYFIALYATGDHELSAELWRNTGLGVVSLGDVPVATWALGFRRQVELALPDSGGIPLELRNNTPVRLMIVSTEDIEGTDAGVYDWIGGAPVGDCLETGEFSADDMICTGPYGKAMARPIEPGINSLQTLSLPRRDDVELVSSGLTCLQGGGVVFVDGLEDPGRYLHLTEADFAGPYAGGSEEDSDGIEEASSFIFYNDEEEAVDLGDFDGDADIRQVRLSSDPDYLYILVEGPSALGWAGGPDLANLFIAIDIPVRETGADVDRGCDFEANAPAGRAVNFRGWDPDWVVEVLDSESAALWNYNFFTGWSEFRTAENDETDLGEVPPGFYYGAVPGSYEIALAWSLLGYEEEDFEPQRIRVSVYTTADENIGGRSDWDVYDQAPGVGQGSTGRGAMEELGDSPFDSDCNDESPIQYSDLTPASGTSQTGAPLPGSDPGYPELVDEELTSGDLDTIETYYIVDVQETPIICAGECSPDVNPPSVVCPPVFVGECDIPPVAQSIEEFDIQGGFVVDECDEELSIQHLGDTEITGLGCVDDPLIIQREYRIYDSSGNSTSCIQEFNIIDFDPPEIELEAEVEVDCGEDTDPEAIGIPIVDDPCDNTELTYEDEVEQDECETIIYRTWTAVDECGYTTTASQVIYVVDVEPPVFTFEEEEIEAFCGDDISPEAIGGPVVTDNCAGDLVVEYEDDIVPQPCGFVIERLWTARDACGNIADADQVIFLADNVAPVMTLPEDVTIQCSQEPSPLLTGFADVDDGCDDEPSVEFEDTIIEGDCDNSWTIERLWIAEDNCGNTTSGVQRITVVDTTAPVLEIPEDAIITCTSESDPSVTGMAEATDNCDRPNVLYSDEIIDGCPVQIRRTWTASDACGNSVSEVQLIEVFDQEPPVLVVPANVVVEGNGSTDPSDTGSATAEDGCSVATVTHNDIIQGGCPGEIIRTWTASDTCGNEVSADQVITLTDTEPPVLTCPADATVGCGDTHPDPSVTRTATAEDACGGAVTVTYSDLVDPDNENRIVRTWMAEDDAGNTATCDQVITLVSAGGIELVGCPEDLEILSCESVPSPADVVAVDACGNVMPVTFTEETIRPVYPWWWYWFGWVNDDDEFTIRRTWTADDGNGGTLTCVQDIVVVESREIIFSGCPEDITLTACDDVPPPADVAAEDACGNPLDVVFTEETERDDHHDDDWGWWFWKSKHHQGDDDGDTIIRRTWTATDADGNTERCRQDIRIEESDGCVSGVGYWKNHPEAWPVDTLTIGCEDYEKSDLIEILDGKSNGKSNGKGKGKGNDKGKGDDTIKLARQVAAAELNIARFDCPPDPGRVEIHLAEAHAFLCVYPIGEDVDNKRDRKVMKELEEKLDDFNDGDAGIRECR